MEYIAYIYDQQGNVIAQIEDSYNVETNLVLSAISDASFDLTKDNHFASKKYIRKHLPIKIYQIIDNGNGNRIEKLMIDGTIRGRRSGPGYIRIIVNDLNYKLNRRKLKKSYSFSQLKLSDIITTIWNDLDTYSPLGMQLQLLDMGEGLVNKEFSVGISFLYVLQELLNDGYERKIENKILYVGKNVGKDRTQGSGFVEYVYAENDAENSNILDYEMTDDADECSSGVQYKGRDKTEYLADEEAVEEYGLRETTITDGTGAAEYLEEHKNGIEEFSIQIDESDFDHVGLGDTVRVQIDGGTDIDQYVGTMRIIEKRLISGDLPRVDLVVSTSKTKGKNIIDKTKELEARILKMELEE